MSLAIVGLFVGGATLAHADRYSATFDPSFSASSGVVIDDADEDRSPGGTERFLPESILLSQDVDDDDQETPGGVERWTLDADLTLAHAGWAPAGAWGAPGPVYGGAPPRAWRGPGPAIGPRFVPRRTRRLPGARPSFLHPGGRKYGLLGTQGGLITGRNHPNF